MKLISIGYGNLISAERMIAMVRPESSPIARIISEARAKGKVIDATRGRKTKAVIIMDSDHVILCANQPVTIGNRMVENETEEYAIEPEQEEAE